MLIRFFLYGLLGWTVEILFTAISSKLRGRAEGWRLRGWTYLYMFPIYGLCAPLFEPAHDRLRHLPWPLRGLIWTAGIFAVEYAAGWGLRRATGRCPWDYALAGARWHVHGLIHLGYAPLWLGFGLALEFLHDRFVVLTPAIRAAFSS